MVSGVGPRAGLPMPIMYHLSPSRSSRGFRQTRLPGLRLVPDLLVSPAGVGR